MTPLAAYLAAERDACLRAAGLSESDVREIAAREIRDAIEDARQGDAGAVEWIDSPAWDVACHLIGRGEVAERWRRIALERITAEAGAPSPAETLREAAALLARWRAAGCSERAVARDLRVSRTTVRKWIERARAHTADALTPVGGDRRAAA